MTDPASLKLKAARWQRYYLSHRDELLAKYRLRYIRQVNKYVDNLIKARENECRLLSLLKDVTLVTEDTYYDIVYPDDKGTA